MSVLPSCTNIKYKFIIIKTELVKYFILLEIHTHLLDSISSCKRIVI